MLDRQDFDEKRLEWRKQKKNVINAIGSMTARVLRFEDKERKTIALHALAFYKASGVVWTGSSDKRALSFAIFSNLADELVY